MKAAIRFFAFDAKANRKYLVGTFALMAVLPFAFRLALGPIAVAPAMAAVFSIVIALPFTFVGQERLRGSMAFLTALPVRRGWIVGLKAFESVAWGAALAAVTLAGVVLANGRNMDGSFVTALWFAPALVGGAACVLTAAYFLFSAQAVTRGFALTLMVVALGSARLAIPAILPFRLTVFLAYGTALAISAGALVLASQIWSRRPETGA